MSLVVKAGHVEDARPFLGSGFVFVLIEEVGEGVAGGDEGLGAALGVFEEVGAGVEAEGVVEGAGEVGG